MEVLGISGSPTSPSRTFSLVQQAIDFAEAVPDKDIQTTVINLGELNVQFCDGRDPMDYKGDTKFVIEKVCSCDGLIVGTPMYRGSCTGMLKNMFDLSVELDTEVLTKVMFTFSNDEILSPLSLPKDLLHTIIDEALQYMEPRASNKQRALISVLKNLKTRDTFTPTKQGKLRQLWLDKIRKQDITKILAKDKRILEWWTSI